MKSLRIALMMALLLPLGGNAVADPRPAGHSGKSSSFKSGFSSQKSRPAKSNGASQAIGGNKSAFGSFGSRTQPADAPAAAKPKSGFGSFGNTPAPAKSSSALSKDLEQNSANANALKTLDARRAAATPMPSSLPPLMNPVSVPGQPQQSPIAVPQSNGLGNAMLGFLVGRSINSGPNQGYYPASVPQNEPETSFGMAVLRTFAWLALLSIIGWIVYFGVKHFKRSKARSAANYSFERD